MTTECNIKMHYNRFTVIMHYNWISYKSGLQYNLVQIWITIEFTIRMHYNWINYKNALQ